MTRNGHLNLWKFLRGSRRISAAHCVVPNSGRGGGGGMKDSDNEVVLERLYFERKLPSPNYFPKCQL